MQWAPIAGWRSVIPVKDVDSNKELDARLQPKWNLIVRVFKKALSFLLGDKNSKFQKRSDIDIRVVE